jgi:hypothetical protein
VRAGPGATRRLRAEGFDPDLFSTLVGASGGPKWLVLRHLDTLLADQLIASRSTPLDTLGSSIGSFRHACHAQSDPASALARLESSYIEQSYSGTGRPTMEEISTESDRILRAFLGETGAREIATNSKVRSHFVAARLRRDRGRDRGFGFQLQLASAATQNAFSRSLLGRSFERVLFGPAKSEIGFDDFPTSTYELDADRVHPAILASGSIPLVMAGVRATPGVQGTLFDGGIIDYHFDFAFRKRPGLVLFPHFFDRIVPGWFDKPLKWRKPCAESLDEVVMLAPSNEFVARLPGGKVPDRNDFLELGTEERIRRWRDVVERCRVLADEFHDLIETKRLADVIQPFIP